MADYEVLAPGGHAHLVSDVKSYADRAGGKGTTQLADGSVTRDKLADGVTDRIDAMRDRCDQLVGNYFFNDIAEGSVLTADDTYAVPPKGVEVYGKSTQVVTTGKNLLSDVEDDWQKLPIPDVATRWVWFIPVDEGASYTYSRNNTGSAGFFLGWCDDTSFTNYENAVTLTNYSTYTVTNTTHAYLVVSCAASGVTQTAHQVSTLIKNRECQIEKASAKTAYEPYTEGVAVPQPSHPQPINSVDDLTLSVCGRNTFDVENAILVNGYFNSGGYIVAGAQFRIVAVPIVPSTTYTLQVTRFTESTSAAALSMWLFNTMPIAGETVGGTRAISINSTATVSGGYHYEGQVTTDADSKYLCISIGNTSTYDYEATLATLQLEYGTTATVYASYTGASASIPLSGHIARSLPDGTRDELTLSYEGPAQTAGYGIFRKTLTQNVQAYGMGDITWTYVTNWRETNVFRCAIPFTTSSMCTAYPKSPVSYSPADDSYMSNVGSWTTAGNLVVRDDSYTTVADFTAAVAGQEIQYALAEPITHDLGTVELPILPCPLTAWADGGSAQPTLAMSYEQDINIVIARLEAAIADLATA